MPKQKTKVEYSNFTRGFITEASPLTFPENASLDELNMNINRDGSRQRRFGFTWPESVEVLNSTSNLTITGDAISSFTWGSAGNNGNNDLGVLQRGRSLFFFDLSVDNPANAYKTSHVFNSSEMPNNTQPMSFTAAYGKLILSVGQSTLYVFSWDGSTLSSPETYDLEIRDLFGLSDSTAIDTRSITLTNTHNYNLRNQGWPEETLCIGDPSKWVSDAPLITDPIEHTFTLQGFYPSDADLIWAAKLETLPKGYSNVDNLGAYAPPELEKSFYGTTPSPKGSFTIDLFHRGLSRTTESGISGIPLEATSGGISSITSFAGRLWYSIREDSLVNEDDNSPFLGNMIFYSQASGEVDKWKSCHTSNDITSEDFNDVLASDGGFISIPEAGEVLKLIPLGGSLYIFATNGVWEVFGGDTGFSAKTQTVVKVTDVGAISAKPIVTGDNIIAYWAASGIHSISLDPTSLRGIENNLTETTIQSYYDEIPYKLRQEAIGVFDETAQQVVWLYNLEDQDSSYYYTKELVLDAVKLSFTKRSFTSVDKTTGWGPYPVGQLQLKRLLKGIQDEVVTVGGVPVTVGGLDVTVSISDAAQKTKSSIMYWFADCDGTSEDFRLGGYLDFNFTDWPEIEADDASFGTDASAFILTGYLTGGDSSRRKFTPYITVNSLRTESDWSEDGSGNVTMVGESSCFLQAQWEWTNNIASGRWTNSQQVYRLPRFFTLDSSHIFAYDVVSTRNKVRGNGKALSLKFSSEAGKDMNILGWGIDVAIERDS